MVDCENGSADFRYGPGLEYMVIEPIENGEVLHITCTADNYFDELSWGQCEFGGYYGWISLSDVRETENPNPLEDLQKVPWSEDERGYYNFAADPEELVYDHFCFEEAEEDGGRSFVIPRINLDSEEIKEINSEIYDMLYPVIIETVKGEAEEEELEDLDYDWYVNDDILSLLISAETTYGQHAYLAYNCSLTEQQPVPDELVYEAAGLSEEEYVRQLRAAMGDAVRSRWEQNGIENKEQYRDSLRDTLDEDNLGMAIPYLGEDGELYAIGAIWFLGEEEIMEWSILNIGSES